MGIKNIQGDLQVNGSSVVTEDSIKPEALKSKPSEGS